VKEVTYKSLTLGVSHRGPIQTASRREPVHILFTLASYRFPPLITFRGEIHQNTPLALWGQLFHQLDHLLVGKRYRRHPSIVTDNRG
jgi:hypothetical protein